MLSDKEIQRDNKEKKIMVRVGEDLKEQFFEKCRRQAINPSAWVRLQIERFVRNN